jgi:hypothetical protein
LSSASTYLSLIRAIEALYESVVTNPGAWGDQAFADWASDTLVDVSDLPKEAVRQVRRSLTAAQKLAAFWSTGSSEVADHDDWRSKIDIGLGPRAWRPTLELARIGLNEAPSEELFMEVKARFAVVNSERWMDGVGYDEWQADS